MAGQANKAVLMQATPVQNTDYTLLNITGEGVIEVIDVAVPTGDSRDARIKITVDGTLKTLETVGQAGVSVILVAGLQKTGLNQNENVFWKAKIYFFTSLKIEIASTAAASAFIYAAAEYQLV